MNTEAPDILLSHTLKILKLPTFQREYQKLARQPSCNHRRRKIGGRVLRRPKRDNPAATVD